MKTWLELDSGENRNDGYAKVSAGGDLTPPGRSPSVRTQCISSVRPQGAARPFVLRLSKGERTGGGCGVRPPQMGGNESK